LPQAADKLWPLLAGITKTLSFITPGWLSRRIKSCVQTANAVKPSEAKDPGVYCVRGQQKAEGGSHGNR